MALHILQQPVSLLRLLSCHVPLMAFKGSHTGINYPVTPTCQVFPRYLQCDRRHPITVQTRDASKSPRPLHVLTSAITEPLDKETSSHLISPPFILTFCRMIISHWYQNVYSTQKSLIPPPSEVRSNDTPHYLSIRILLSHCYRA